MKAPDLTIRSILFFLFFSATHCTLHDGFHVVHHLSQSQKDDVCEGNTPIAAWYNREVCHFNMRTETCFADHRVATCVGGVCADPSNPCSENQITLRTENDVFPVCCQLVQYAADLLADVRSMTENETVNAEDVFLFAHGSLQNTSNCQKALICDPNYGAEPNVCFEEMTMGATALGQNSGEAETVSERSERAL